VKVKIIKFVNAKKKILAYSSDEIEKNQNYRFNDEIKNKLKFDKIIKNKN
jgi:hypothetical protein